MAVQGNKTTLSDLESFLSELTEPLFLLIHPQTRYSAGEQVRHILEHYQMLFGSLTTGVLCYDQRPRNKRLESSLGEALSTLHDITLQLDTLCSEGDKALSLTCAVDGCQQRNATIETTLIRELLFLQNHTIHHMAILKILFQEHDKTLPDRFGVAPATLQYQSTCEATSTLRDEASASKIR
ncbi:DinB family protein [Parendozoicomonas haliclonae]|uniref:DinB family protein n=2 Tax=Parendozoicomonas haliclonae TaxID=1960125 RepID=A0A1X7AQ67_9GAMM|nr:hypothetical protein EHSB41UT_04056 [Parendozoicomonas haliclonae]